MSRASSCIACRYGIRSCNIVVLRTLAPLCEEHEALRFTRSSTSEARCDGDIALEDAWTQARDYFIKDLSREEKVLFRNASPDSILYDTSIIVKTHSSNSNSLKVVNKLRPLVAAVQQYGTAFDVLSNTCPPIMSPLWGSIRVLLHLAREFGKYFDRIVEMLARIGDVLPRFRLYEEMYPNHERLIQTLSATYVDIIAFCTKSKAVFHHGQRSRLTNLSIGFKLSWKSFERQFEEEINGFNTHLRMVEKEANLSHMIEAANSRALVLANQKQIEIAKKEIHRHRVITTIPSVDNEAKHEKVRRLRYEGTGNWIFRHEAFRRWRHSARSSALSCYGIPGCGKTVLASKIIDELRSAKEIPEAIVVFHYCDYADQRTLQPDRIIGTLLKQFFANGQIPERIEAQLPLDYGASGQTLEVIELMGLLSIAVRLNPAVFIVLDGFDECEKVQGQRMIDFFNSLLNLGEVVVKTLVLCREEDQLLRSLQNTSSLRITPSALESDIQKFIVGSVRSRRQAGDLKLRDSKLEQEIISELAEKAHGMFLWVFFQLNDLCEAPSDAIVRQTLQNLPDGLIETFERILKKMEQSKIKRKIARDVFIWIACARRPMKVEEVREAIAFEPCDKSWNPDKIPDDDLMIES